MGEEFLGHLLGNIGVPAALCFYTLFEVNKNVKRLADSINRLGDDVDKRISRIDAELHALNAEVKIMIRKEGLK